MDLLFVILGFIGVIVGIIGSFLPVIPGIPLSWLGLLLMYLAPSIPFNYWFLGVTFLITVFIYFSNFIVPAWGTKKYGGSKKGMIGATLGLIIGLITPIPFGILIGAFLGAFLGELFQSANSKLALKAAYGSFIGFLASTFMEVMVTFVFLILFIIKVWHFKGLIF